MTDAPEYILHGAKYTRSLLVEMVLAEAGLTYRIEHLDMLGGDHRQPAFLELNPSGWIPALVTPTGEVLYETPAINLWLCETHGLDLVPMPGDPARGAFLSAFHNLTGELEPALKRAFFPWRYAPEKDQAEAARAIAWRHVAARLRPIERRLIEQGPYLAGARFSLADLTLAYWTPYVVREGMMALYPNIARVAEAARARPALTQRFALLDAWVAEVRR